jgi:lipoprotein-anchoring transpeptidase ErfK/SrfK
MRAIPVFTSRIRKRQNAVTKIGQGAIMKRLWDTRLARLALAAAFIMAGLALTPAHAAVVVQIDKSSQRMAVSIDGTTRYSWPVSTGRNGYGTPSGVFQPQLMARRWFSRKYYNSPMPHSIFFYYGFAIHGTNDISRLGGPASHGCVRLHPSHAAALFALVQRNGPGNTRIEISN